MDRLREKQKEIEGKIAEIDKTCQDHRDQFVEAIRKKQLDAEQVMSRLQTHVKDDDPLFEVSQQYDVWLHAERSRQTLVEFRDRLAKSVAKLATAVEKAEMADDIGKFLSDKELDQVREALKAVDPNAGAAVTPTEAADEGAARKRVADSVRIAFPRPATPPANPPSNKPGKDAAVGQGANPKGTPGPSPAPSEKDPNASTTPAQKAPPAIAKPSLEEQMRLLEKIQEEKAKVDKALAGLAAKCDEYKAAVLSQMAEMKLDTEEVLKKFQQEVNEDDTLFELYHLYLRWVTAEASRNGLVRKGNRLAKSVTRLTTAVEQAKILRELEDALTDKELDEIRRELRPDAERSDGGLTAETTSDLRNAERHVAELIRQSRPSPPKETPKPLPAKPPVIDPRQLQQLQEKKKAVEDLLAPPSQWSPEKELAFVEQVDTLGLDIEKLLESFQRGETADQRYEKLRAEYQQWLLAEMDHDALNQLKQRFCDAVALVSGTSPDNGGLPVRVTALTTDEQRTVENLFSLVLKKELRPVFENAQKRVTQKALCRGLSTRFREVTLYGTFPIKAPIAFNSNGQFLVGASVSKSGGTWSLNDLRGGLVPIKDIYSDTETAALTSAWLAVEQKVSEELALYSIPGFKKYSKAWSPNEGEHLLALSPDGRRLAARVIRQSGYDYLELYDIPNLDRIGFSSGPNGGRWTKGILCFSPDSKLLTVGLSGPPSLMSSDYSIQVNFLSVPDLTLLKSIPLAAKCVAFSPDGQYLAIGTTDSVQFWSIPDMHLLHESKGPSPATSIAFNPNGKLVAIANARPGVRIRCVPALEAVSDIPCGEPVVRCHFSPSGKMLAVTKANGTDVWISTDAREDYWAADWSDARAQPHGAVVIKNNGSVYAGDLVWIDAAVATDGKGDMMRLHAWLETSSPTFATGQWIFGRIAGGGKTTRRHSWLLAPDHPPGEVRGTIHFSEHNGFVPGNQPVLLKVLPLPRADFPVSATVIDDRSGNSIGNGNGKADRGEAVDIELSFENKIGFDLCELQATLRILEPTDGIKAVVPSAIIDPLTNGQKGSVRFTVNIAADCKPCVSRIESTISARDGRVFSKMPIEMPIGTPADAAAKSDSPPAKP